MTILPNSIYKFKAIKKKKKLWEILGAWQLILKFMIEQWAKISQDNYKDQCGETSPLRCECLL